jgi:multiple sugar transport system substrate-binding protein
MMRTRIKGLAIAALFGAALAACGNDPAPPAAPPAEVAAGAQEVEEQAPADEAPADAAEASSFIQDMDGRDFVFGSWWVIGMDSESEEPDIATATNFVTEHMAWENIQNIHNDFNATITATAFGWGDILPLITTSVMAGDPLADLIMIEPQWLMPLIAGNLIIPIEEIGIPSSADIFNAQNWVMYQNPFDGRHWTMNQASINTAGNFLGVNLDIIHAIGAEDPRDLVDRGEWNWNTFLDIMRTATTSTGGDGVIDQFGIAGGINFLVEGIISSNDGVTIDPETFSFGYDDPRTVRALEFVNQILAVERLWQFDEAWNVELWDTFWTFERGEAAFFPAALWSINTELPFDFTVVPWPQGPDNIHGYAGFVSFEVAMVMPRGVHNPVDIYTIFERYHAPFGYDLDMRDQALRDDVEANFLRISDVDRFFHAVSNRKQDIGLAVDQYLWMPGDFGQYLFRGDYTLSQIIEIHRPRGQDLLDQAFEFMR